MGAGVEVTCVRGSSAIFLAVLCVLMRNQNNGFYKKNMAKFWANVYSRMGRYPIVFVVWGFLRNL